MKLYMFRVAALVVSLMLCGAAARGQETPKKASEARDARLTVNGDAGSIADSVSVVPGDRYAKGGFVRFFAGAGYRDLWTVPLTVEVADLSQIGGGLTVLRLGGGATTRTLHMIGEDGKRYVGRSVDKYPGQGLVEELQGTAYEAVLQDQISSFHPSGALVVPALLDAVGVLHAEPRLYVLPDDERLGEFRELMRGELVIIEERPDEGPDDSPGFAGSRKIVGTSKFFENLDEDWRNQLDARTYLSARLVDLLVGDRDKSVNNWRWARFDRGDEYVWQPIPRDRDQAFIELDGFSTSVIRLYEPRLVRFSKEVPSVVGLTRSAWAMDRPFLVSLEKSVWDSVVTAVQFQLSDAVIDGAVRRMPPEHLRVYARTLASRLKVRRDRLREASDKFYRIVSEFADVHGTDVPELAIVDQESDGRTTVRLSALPADRNADSDREYFRRTFDPRETREIRLYLHGGADRVLVRGRHRDAIALRIIGGRGADTLVDSSATRFHFYDAGDRTQVVGGHRHRWVRRHAKRPIPWGDTGPRSPDWGHLWLQKFAFPYSSDLGLLTYVGATRTGYGFLHDPHRSLLSFGAGYAPFENKFVADIKYEERHLLSGLHGSIRLRYTEIEILNFYGFGNDTQDDFSRSFYKLRRGALHAVPVATIPVGESLEFDLDVRFELSDTDMDPDEPNLVSRDRPYGSGSFIQSGAGAAVRFDTRDRVVAPTRGVLLTGVASAYPEVFDVDQGTFGKVGGEFSTYWSLPSTGNQTVALRVGAQKLFGTFPYYEAAFLGGPDRLRGFREERFAGDASAYGSAELRLYLREVSAFLPWHVGVFGFADTGRVFLDGDSPGGWHVSGGGGIWIAPLYSRFTASLTVARSKEETMFYVRTGFGI